MIILAIDPGSTSTKVGVYQDGRTQKGGIEHPRPEIGRFASVMEQFDYRMQAVRQYLQREGYAACRFDAVVGRGGLVRPVPGGIYRVNDLLVRDLRDAVSGEHAANLGGVLALGFAERHGVPAFVVDPPVIDEMWPLARFSGLEGIERKSMFHALNQKAVARDVAQEMGRRYDEINLIVVHMGSGITAGAHLKGRVVDVNNGLNGDGPFSPERSGGLPVIGVLELIEQGSHTPEELKVIVARKGGLFSYLGSPDLREVEQMAAQGDVRARVAVEAMIYQVAKEIGALAAALDGEVDGIVLTGGVAFSASLVEQLTRKVRFIAPVHLRPGEHEIEALLAAAIRVLNGEEQAKEYTGERHEDRG